MMTPDQIRKMVSSEHFFAVQEQSKDTEKYLKRIMKTINNSETTEECIDRIQAWPTENILTRKMLLDMIVYASLKKFLPIGTHLTLFDDHIQYGFTYYGALAPIFEDSTSSVFKVGTYLGLGNITKPVGYALGANISSVAKKGVEERRYLFIYDSAYTIDMIVKNVSLLLYTRADAINPDWEVI